MEDKGNVRDSPDTYWRKKYQEKEALWVHDGDAKRPHALLRAGNHSSGFFNSELVMEDPLVLDEATRNLVESAKCHFWKRGWFKNPLRVVGPAMGAITLAHDLARHFGSYCECRRAYTEKSDDGATMVFSRTTISRGEHVLLCEDVITTGRSIELSLQAVERAGGIVLPLVLALVNRSAFTEVSGKKIIALVDHPMPVWKPNECPLCAQHSEAIRPKYIGNWERLNAVYS